MPRPCLVLSLQITLGRVLVLLRVLGLVLSWNSLRAIASGVICISYGITKGPQET